MQERKEDEFMQHRSIRESLSLIPTKVRGEIRNKLVPWIYTNDHDFAALMPYIQEAVVKQQRGTKPRVAVLSGVGAFANVAPYMNVDAIVSVDRNSFVLDQVLEMADTIRSSSTLADFESSTRRADFFARMKVVGIEADEYWQMEKASFADQHLTASTARYADCRATLLKTPVLTTQGNFVHEPYVKALAEALKNTDITYASFTDLAEWSPEFFDIIQNLPMTKNAVVVWSTNQNQGKPEARMSVGLENYILEGRAAADNLKGKVTYHAPHV